MSGRTVMRRGLISILAVVGCIALVSAPEAPAQAQQAAAGQCTPAPNLKTTLAQWQTDLEAWKGGNHFLMTPTDEINTDCAKRLELLLQWWSGLQSVHGSPFLEQPTSANSSNCRDTLALMTKWHRELEKWRGQKGVLWDPASRALCGK